MSLGLLVPILALLIPIIAIIARHLRRWQELEVEAARRAVDIKRQFRTFDLIEQRVGDIEAHITSRDYHLNREIGRLAEKS